MIRTEKAKPAERLTAAEDDGRRGLIIQRGITLVLRTFMPVVVLQEGNAGSKSARAAAALARAQQACLDAIDLHMGSTPILLTQQAVKKAVTGRFSDVSKDDMERAARRLWPVCNWPRLLITSLTGASPPGEWENAYDAACVASCGWDQPAVAVARKLV